MRHRWALRFSSFGRYNHYFFFSEMIENYHNFSTHKLNMVAAKVKNKNVVDWKGHVHQISPKILGDNHNTM